MKPCDGSGIRSQVPFLRCPGCLNCRAARLEEALERTSEAFRRLAVLLDSDLLLDIESALETIRALPEARRQDDR